MATTAAEAALLKKFQALNQKREVRTGLAQMLRSLADALLRCRERSEHVSGVRGVKACAWRGRGRCSWGARAA